MSNPRSSAVVALTMSGTATLDVGITTITGVSEGEQQAVRRLIATAATSAHDERELLAACGIPS